MRLIAVLILFFVSVGNTGLAQTTAGNDVWSLQRCVSFAVEHNISVRQDSLTARLARYTLLQSQLSQLPTVSANGNLGRSYGRSINPTTNQFIDADYNALTVSGNGNLLLWGWGMVRNTIAKNRYALLASLADLDQMKDDISLNVANGYLAALLAQEQINISRNQVGLSQAQLDQTRAFAEAGRLPELNVAQLESQLASDSATLINAIANYNSSILDLKSLLNLDFSEPLTIQVPGIEVSEQLAVSAMQPEEIYRKARTHFGGIKSSELKVQSAQKSLAASKSALYPQLSVGYQAGTNWADNFLSYQPTDQLIGLAPIGITGHSLDTVYQPVYKTLTPVIPFNNQFSNNFRQMIFVGVNVPIFNGWSSQYAIRQARISLAQQELSQYNTELTLKQNVYKAHNNALNSIQKYYAARRADEAARRALDFARKRYELGLTSTVDLLVTENQAFTTEANLVSAKYDLIFKLKVIDYYLGKELKL